MSTEPTPPLTRQDLVRGLRDLGVRRGELLEVHSSLSSLGWVEGGAETVVEALMEAVGPEGTLVMSAYMVSPAVLLTPEDVARGVAWKVLVLPPDSPERTGMGAIADAFRRRPDVIRGVGDHPTAAWGRHAERHTEGYGALVDGGGRVLLIGVGIDRCSSMHCAESRCFPPDIWARLAGPPEVLAHYPSDRWIVGVGEPTADAWATVWRLAMERGLVHTGHIGAATCHLFTARDVVGIYEAMLSQDPYRTLGMAPPV